MQDDKNLSNKLAGYKQIIDADIAEYSEQLLGQTQDEYDAYSREALEVFTSVLHRGGKRMRGSLVLVGYEMFGGQDRQSAIVVARALEMVHACLLILDDIADGSVMRRGGPAAHILMRDYHTTHKLRGQAVHFGEAAATHIGALGEQLAERLIDELDIADHLKLAVFRSLHKTLVNTYHGQIRDIFNVALPTVTEDDALRVAELKTAYYSLCGPLETGALLAGAGDSDIALLREYGLYAGLAFQITDDVIGIFGDQAKAGKSPLDDLKEGKITILVAAMLDRANADQQMRLKAMLGNPDVSQDDLRECQKIATETGALEYVNGKAKDFADKANAVIKKVPKTWDPDLVEFLRQLSQSFIARQS